MTNMGMTCDFLLLADWVVTQDEQRQIFEKGAVAVHDSRITYVGPAREVPADLVAETRLDLGQKMILPGLVNTHTHAAMSIFRGVADDLPLMEWLTKHIWPMEQKLDEQKIYLGALLACAEMLRSGTTCFTDMYLIEKATAQAADQSGIRAVLGEGIFAFPSPAYSDPAYSWDILKEFHEGIKDNARIRPVIAPHAVYTTTPEILSKSFALAQELDCGWKIHLSETEYENEECLKQQGQRPLDYLDSLGILDERSLLVHCVEINEQEISLMADRQCGVAHNPKSNMKLGNGPAPVQAMLDAGVNVSLGTDGAASNNSLNMFSEMSFAALLQKGFLRQPTALPASKVLDMATCNGAKALGWPQIGSLGVGQRADLIALDLQQPGLQPMFNPVSHAAYACNGGEVSLTMVEGQIVYKDGNFTNLDYPALLHEIQGVRSWIIKNKQG